MRKQGYDIEQIEGPVYVMKNGDNRLHLTRRGIRERLEHTPVPDSNGGAQKPVLLLDLGGVVLGIDFHRVFQHWAAASGVEASLFYDSWTLDQAYKDQEIGRIDFHQYTAHLSKTLACR